MATQNRGTRITKLLGQIKKHYKPASPPKNRSLLEHLLFACLLENSPQDAAEEAFDKLENDYFDWNEVRVSTKRELSDTLKTLSDPDKSAERLKRVLHSVFESVYVYDLELLKKQNLGQAVKTIEKYEGATPFVVAYVTQNALSGHSIPCNQGVLIAFVTFDLISEAEASKSHVPGLERAVPKAKGVEMGSILHQFGVEIAKNPYGQAARKLLLSIDGDCKSRLPKKPEPPAPKKPAPKKAAKKAPAEAAKPGKKKAVAAKTKKVATKGAAQPTKKKKVKKKVLKKKVKKKVAKKPTTSSGKKKKTKAVKKKTGKKISKRKPK